MGVVYKARDTHLDRFVAIKVLPAGAVADRERKRRFVQEAKAASALNHPNIVTIHDIASEDGTDFIVMEYVPGKTLDELIPRKGMRLNQALKYAIQVTDALAAAHEAGIVHRDLKPGNVMVTKKGQVKVLDFGLAKLTDAAPVSEEQPTVSLRPATEEGTILGTVAYMAPEQAQGHGVDPRSDIFSFGAMLYEMFTGQQAFSGDSKMSTLVAIIQKEPAPLTGKVPRDLQKVVARCLRKDPQRRFQHMKDVAIELQEAMEESESGQLAPASEPLRRRRLAAAVTVLIAAVGAWYLWLRPGPPEAPVRVLPLTAYPGYEDSPRFSPDGNHVAFTWDGDVEKNTDIYVKMIGSATPLRLTSDPGMDIAPAWSPDGRFIAFARDWPDEKRAAVLLVPSIRGPEHVIWEGEVPEWISPPCGPLLAWLPDSKWLVGSTPLSQAERRGLFLLSAETGERRELTTSLDPGTFDFSPSVSPDGRAIAFSRDLGSNVAEIYLVSLGDNLAPRGEPSRLTFLERYSHSAVWTPDGREIVFYSDGALWRVPASGSAKPALVTIAAEQASWPAVSHQGNRLAYVKTAQDVNIWRLPLPLAGARAGPATRHASSTRHDENAQYSPDGERIVFASDRTGSAGIWTSDADGSNAEQLFSTNAYAGSPRWSPDGRQIAFDCSEEGNWDIYLISVKGGWPTRLTTEPSQDSAPSWSRDGKWVYFGSNRTGEYQVWKIPADSQDVAGRAVQVTRNGGYAALESRDAKCVYYLKTWVEYGSSSLWKVPVGGGEERPVLESVYGRAFSVGKEGLYFIGRRSPSGVFSVQLLDFGSGKVTEMAPLAGELRLGLSVSPDRRYLLYSQADVSDRDLMLVENFR